MTANGADGRGISRRGVLLGAGAGLAAGAVAATVVGTLFNSDGEKPGGSVPAAGTTQGGVARPTTPQRRGLIAVFTIPVTPARAVLRERLAALGSAVLDDTDSAAGPGDLTVTVGIGPRLVSVIDGELPGAAVLPDFRGDEGITPERNGGDLMIAVHASEGATLHAVLSRVAAAVPEAELTWDEELVRAAGTGTVVRNPLGYLDGIMVPHSDDELAENVWIPAGPAAGGTICVIRRLRLDLAGFGDRPEAERDAIIGRHRVDGSPLSGGDRDDEVDLRAKTEAGDYLTPAHSHVRAAHPSFTGSRLMLRRGYVFGTESDDSGLMFVCFQNELDTFVKTQQRLDEVDDLMAFTEPTASGSFLVLPGFSRDSPLGSSLFNRSLT
jgi:dye decolorizing peroxidase